MSKRAEDSLDDKILAILNANGRMSNTDVARQLSVSETTVRQRIKRMIDSSEISFNTLVDLRILGINTVAMIRLLVAPDRISNVIQDLRQVREIGYLARLIGQYNIALILSTKDNEELDAVIQKFIFSRNDVLEVNCRLISKAFKYDTGVAPIRGPIEGVKPISLPIDE